ncbi:hypothetical protein C8T65DRAFT_737731 [Cerioporus squamosus]|nr:hypothetical protein C8T65DRAFT_737731 [Cerioporus squamosus]
MGKARRPRVRSPFAREHYAQLDATREAKDRKLVAARKEIAMLKKALRVETSPALATKRIPVQGQTETSTKAGKENVVPRTPSKPTSSSSSVSPLRKAVTSSPSSSSRLPLPSTSPKVSSEVPRSSIPVIARPPLARLPRPR